MLRELRFAYSFYSLISGQNNISATTNNKKVKLVFQKLKPIKKYGYCPLRLIS